MRGMCNRYEVKTEWRNLDGRLQKLGGIAFPASLAFSMPDLAQGIVLVKCILRYRRRMGEKLEEFRISYSGVNFDVLVVRFLVRY